MSEHCADCQTLSPKTATNYTLIGQVGWRLLRSRDENGNVALEWRCPTCWRNHKAGANARPSEIRLTPAAGSRAARSAYR